MALVLNRKLGETVTIGDDITVTILSIIGNQVRLGVAAPPNVAVHRQEIYDLLKRNSDNSKKS